MTVIWWKDQVFHIKTLLGIYNAFLLDTLLLEYEKLQDRNVSAYK